MAVLPPVCHTRGSRRAKRFADALRE